MKYQVHFVNNKKDIQGKELVFIKLNPETAPEEKLLKENTDNETIELYYHDAIEKELPDYALLAIVDESGYPYQAIAKVQSVKGM